MEVNYALHNEQPGCQNWDVFLYNIKLISVFVRNVRYSISKRSEIRCVKIEITINIHIRRVGAVFALLQAFLSQVFMEKLVPRNIGSCFSRFLSKSCHDFIQNVCSFQLCSYMLRTINLFSTSIPCFRIWVTNYIGTSVYLKICTCKLKVSY